MKQTAVDWMVTEIIEALQHGDKDFVYWKLKTAILEKAKQMEKQQIEEAYCMGDDNIGAEQYYNETFKSE
jgi:hypothetical protein